MNLPKISVIVPHYSDLANLTVCLEALEGQTCPRHQFEIVVADNGSSEGEAELAKLIGNRARLVIIGERGAGPARNGGVAAARGEVLAFTDADCRPTASWLEQGVAALAACDVVGGRVDVLVSDPAHITPTEGFERVFAFDNEAYVTRKGFSLTANLFCRKATFDRVGPFRVGVSEDVDWCRRALARGCSLVYAPSAVVGHPARRTWGELVAKWRRLNIETYGLLREQAGGRVRWLLQLLLLPASAVLHTPQVLVSDRLSSPGQRLAALGVLYRLRFWRCADALRLLLAAR